MRVAVPHVVGADGSQRARVIGAAGEIGKAALDGRVLEAVGIPAGQQRAGADHFEGGVQQLQHRQIRRRHAFGEDGLAGGFFHQQRGQRGERLHHLLVIGAALRAVAAHRQHAQQFMQPGEAAGEEAASQRVVTALDAQDEPYRRRAEGVGHDLVVEGAQARLQVLQREDEGVAKQHLAHAGVLVGAQDAQVGHPVVKDRPARQRRGEDMGVILRLVADLRLLALLHVAHQCRAGDLAVGGLVRHHSRQHRVGRAEARLLARQREEMLPPRRQRRIRICQFRAQVVNGTPHEQGGSGAGEHGFSFRVHLSPRPPPLSGEGE
ncbi:MAG: hypothetical protein BWY76_02713 [bacterium ADurb.Bin429]|nr:MAG: hypothetical protein BWY76_02713 [bacterium ADurb.Bin429]